MASEEKQYRVLHIFSAFGGGISSLIMNLLENKARNFSFDILAFSYDKGEQFLERVEKTGTQSFLMPRIRESGYKHFKKFLKDFLAQHSYDAVHCHIDGWRARPFYVAAKKAGIKTFVIHAHKTKYESGLDRTFFMRKVNKKCNFKFATDYMICSDLAGEYVFGAKYMQRKNTVMIPNGMNEEIFQSRLSVEQKQTYAKEFQIPENAFIIAHVGRFNYQKNHVFLLEIIKELSKKHSNIITLMVGTGELFDEIKKRSKEMQIQDNVRFLGRRNDVNLLMQYADLVVLPSLCEGLPTVAVECQATGTPMLLSDSITRQCDMGLSLLEFLPNQDAKVWCEKICEIMKQPSKKLPLEECVETIKSKGFTAKTAGEVYCLALEKMINKR